MYLPVELNIMLKETHKDYGFNLTCDKIEYDFIRNKSRNRLI